MRVWTSHSHTFIKSHIESGDHDRSNRAQNMPENVSTWGLEHLVKDAPAAAICVALSWGSARLPALSILQSRICGWPRARCCSEWSYAGVRSMQRFDACSWRKPKMPAETIRALSPLSTDLRCKPRIHPLTPPSRMIKDIIMREKRTQLSLETGVSFSKRQGFRWR
jgi:hypothetical protein